MGRPHDWTQEGEFMTRERKRLQQDEVGNLVPPDPMPTDTRGPGKGARHPGKEIGLKCAMSMGCDSWRSEKRPSESC